LRQRRNQIPVQFDHIERTGHFQQARRDRTLAWTDLDQMLTWLWVDGVEDALNHPGVMEKVLAETLTGLVGMLTAQGCAGPVVET
jgi:hypothetical protein